jgi:hypothetical protein
MGAKGVRGKESKILIFHLKLKYSESSISMLFRNMGEKEMENIY